MGLSQPIRAQYFYVSVPDSERYEEAWVLAVLSESLAENAGAQRGRARHSLPVQRPRQHQEGRPVVGLHLQEGAGLGSGQGQRDVLLHPAWNIGRLSDK